MGQEKKGQEKDRSQAKVHQEAQSWVGQSVKATSQDEELFAANVEAEQLLVVHVLICLQHHHHYLVTNITVSHPIVATLLNIPFFFKLTTGVLSTSSIILVCIHTIGYLIGKVWKSLGSIFKNKS